MATKGSLGITTSNNMQRVPAKHREEHLLAHLEEDPTEELVLVKIWSQLQRFAF